MKTPYDGRFKILAEEYPDLLLRLLGIVGPGMKTQPIDIVRELQLDPVQADHVYRIGPADSGRLVHFEAITSWRAQRVPVLALYRFLLMHKFKLPVSSYIVLMAEKYAPRTLPAKVVYEEPDGIRIEAPYQVIRLWEIDPSIAFERGAEPLLPWVPLLKGGAAEFEQASAAIEWLVDHPGGAPYPAEVMVSNLATLATLRYDKDAISHFLERLKTKIMLSTDLFVESWLYQDGLAAGEAKGEARGEAKGEAKGQLDGKRSSVRLALHKKFPALAASTDLNQIRSSEVLDNLLLAIMDARDADDARAALEAALRVI